MKIDHLSDYDKNRIIVYYNDNFSIKEISNKMNINRHTASKWIERYKEYGITGLKRKEGSGIKDINKKDEDNDTSIVIINLILNNKCITLRMLKQELNDKHNHKISLYKIQNLLSNKGFVYGLPPKRINLTEEIKQKRLIFAIKYQNFNWEKVSFYDEAGIWNTLKTLKRWFNKNLGIDYDVMFKHSDKLNIWALINVDFKKIHVFSENMNADKYISILKDNLLNDNRIKYILCDNDSKHTSKKANNFYTKNNIKIIDFPSYSPDLNPIENIFSVLKMNIQKRKNEIKRENFKEIITETWSNIDKTIIQNTILSMPNRLKRLIELKGGYIDQ